MRKNSPRKWLHACLDLLPVLLIPVFMIYSHRHTLTEQAQAVPVYETNEVNSFQDLHYDNIYQVNLNGKYNEDIEDVMSFSGILLTEIKLDNSALNRITGNAPNEFGPYCYIRIQTSGNLFWYYASQQAYDDDEYTLYQYTGQYLNNPIIQFKGSMSYAQGLFSETNYNVYEIEQGSPNIMNVFMDSFNTSIDKYFNMGNVFNLGGVYDWFNTNIFNGNAPQVIYSVWNIALYELVMDLLFLLYGLFMWFIDVVEHIMDKPFKSVK